MDPVILYEPSHVSLNHLYAQSIRENMLVLSSTTRNENLYLLAYFNLICWDSFLMHLVIFCANFIIFEI